MGTLDNAHRGLLSVAWRKISESPFLQKKSWHRSGWVDTNDHRTQFMLTMTLFSWGRNPESLSVYTAHGMPSKLLTLILAQNKNKLCSGGGGSIETGPFVMPQCWRHRTRNNSRTWTPQVEDLDCRIENSNRIQWKIKVTLLIREHILHIRFWAETPMASFQ